MKNLAILFLCVLVVLPTAAFGAASADQILKIDRPANVPDFIGYAQDRVIVVMKPDVGNLRVTYSANAVAQTGIQSLDAIADRYSVSGIRQQFAGAERKLNPEAQELARYHKVRFEQGTPEEVQAAYASNPLVDRVELVGIHSLHAVPNDGFFDPYQWYHQQTSDDDIDSPEGWDIQTGSTAMIVAILDSGTRYYHPDLGGVNASPASTTASRGNMWINNAELNGSAGVDDDANGFTDDWIGWDFLSSASNCWQGEDCSGADNDPRDFNGHGTHTSGIVGMITNDGYGMAGTAGGWSSGSQAEYGNGCKVMACRIGHSYNYLGQEVGVVYMDFAAEAFYYAADNGAKIASCSWGSSNSGGIAAAINYFLANGGMIFKSAGNSNNQATDYMTARSDIISVAATNEVDNKASFSSYGTWVDISAPGDNIYATYHDHNDPNTNYWASLGGTSMACPMAAGVAALIWSQNPGWTASQVETQLYSSAENIDSELSPAYVGLMGAGRVNIFDAVNTGPPPAPVADFSGTPTSGTEPLTVTFTDLSTGSITSWSWAFGDTGTSSDQNPKHTYNAAGTYDVTLTVTGPGGSDPETKLGYITVNQCVPPTAGFTGTPTSGDHPLNVAFTNSSSGATSYLWNFGDGVSSTATNPNHTYTAAGPYTVTLTADNVCGSDQDVKTNYITVTDPPSGSWITLTYDDFEGGLGNYSDGGRDMSLYTGGTHAHQGSNAADIQDNSGVGSSFYHTNGIDVSGYSDLEVEFWFRMVSMETNEDFWLQYFNGSSWQIVATWAQGAGFVNNQFYNVTVQIPAGTYNYPTNARLRFMCDASGNPDDVYIDEIEFRGLSTGGPPAPVAEFSGTPTSGDAPLNVAFTDLSSGTVDSWVWTFGDFATSTAQNPSHLYTTPGTYNVSLTVTGPDGSDGETKDGYITVTDPSGGGWATIVYEDFEGGFGNYSDGGSDCILYTGGSRAHQGSNAADIQDNTNSSVVTLTNAIDATAYDDLEVEFWFYPNSMENNEDFWLQVDTGSGWTTEASWARGTDFNNGSFYNDTVNLGAYTSSSNLRIRFRCDASGNGDDIYIDEVDLRGLTGGASSDVGSLIADHGMVPGEFALNQNFPNPFNPTTSLAFTLPEASQVELTVYNVIGQRVVTLARGHYAAGKHTVTWNARENASGVYFYRIQAGANVSTRSMMLLK